MIFLRRCVLVAAPLIGALTLGACSAATDGTPSRGSTAPGTPSRGSTAPRSTASGSPSSLAPATAPVTNGAFPKDAAGLAALLARGTANTTSVHVVVTQTSPAGSFTATSDVTVSGGTQQASVTDVTQRGRPRVTTIQVDGKQYVRLPVAERSAPDKPWALVTATSSNPHVRLYARTSAVFGSARPDAAGTFARATSSLTIVGTEAIDGVDAAHYSLTVDVAKLPDSTSKTALGQIGVTRFPVELYVDADGHTRRYLQKFTVGGTPIVTRATLGDYNAPLTITPPPASRTSTD